MSASQQKQPQPSAASSSETSPLLSASSQGQQDDNPAGNGTGTANKRGERRTTFTGVDSGGDGVDGNNGEPTPDAAPTESTSPLTSDAWVANAPKKEKRGLAYSYKVRASAKRRADSLSPMRPSVGVGTGVSFSNAPPQVVHAPELTSAHDASSATDDEEDQPEDSLRSISSLTYEELTKSIRQHTFPEQGVGLAAFFLRDALLGVNSTGTMTYNPYTTTFRANLKVLDPCRNAFSLLSRKVLSERWFEALVKGSVLALILLSFIEPPPWCADQNAGNGGGDDSSGVIDTGISRCQELMASRGPPAFVVDENDTQRETDSEYYPNFHMLYLSESDSLWWETVFAFVLVSYVALSLGRDGLSIYRYFDPSTGEKGVRVVRLASILGLAYGVTTSAMYGGGRPLAPYWRLLIFISFSKTTRVEIMKCVKLVPDLLRIFLFLFIVIVFYGWIGVVAFFETEEGSDSFSNLVEGMWSLWIMVTTANYPDVMMPAYNENRLAFIFFVSYMIIAYYGLMNIILAAVVNNYTNETEETEETAKKQREEKLRQAFRCLDIHGTGISRQTLKAVFLLLNKDCPDIKYITHDSGELFFAILDKDGSGVIGEEEFMQLGDIMSLEFQRLDDFKPFVQRHFPSIYNSRWFQKMSQIVKSDKFEMVIDIILVLNAIVVAIQSYPELSGQTRVENPRVADGSIDTAWEVAETVFTIVYCIEMFLKVIVYGWKRYISSFRNFFDGSITILTLAATAYVYYPNAFSDSRLIRYIVMARVLRLLRLVIAVKQFQVLGRTFIDILPAASRIFLLLCCLMFFFSALGVHLYGGKITRDPSNPLSELLKGTDFADCAYWANNFNDMMSGMNVCFNLLVVNNWPEQASGFTAVTESKWPRFFFLAFHILGVVVVNNIVTSFIIDAFMTEWNATHDYEQTEEENAEGYITDRGQIVFDAGEVTGTKTQLSGEYIAKIKDYDHTKAEKLHNLRRIFTKKSSSST